MITTLDTVKAILGINDKDVQITMLIKWLKRIICLYGTSL